MSALSPAAQAWITAADAAAVAEAKAEHEEYLVDAPSYMRDIVADDGYDPINPDEDWQAPFGPDVPEGAPVLLLDVDGPLSPFGTPTDGEHWPR